MFLRLTNLEELRSYSFELQTTAEKYFKIERVREYLTIVTKNQGADIAMGVMAYIMIVLGKYVLMMTAYNIHKENTEAVTELYEWVTSMYLDYTTLFRDVTGRSLNIDKAAMRTLKDIKKKLADHQEPVASASNSSEVSSATKLNKLLECPVCLEEMRPPVKIFQCSNGHALCEHCKDNPHVKSCPTCRVVFTTKEHREQ